MLLGSPSTVVTLQFIRLPVTDCIFPNNLTVALYTLPLKRYDLCPITGFTYVLEEVYIYKMSLWTKVSPSDR